MSINGSSAASAAVYQAAVPCPCDTFSTNGADDGHRRSKPVDRVESREQAALMAAFAAANTGLAQDQRGLVRACAAVDESARRVEGGIEAVERFAAIRSVRKSRERSLATERLHADDGPEDLRRPPTLWRVLLWPVLVAGVVFDAMFIGSVIRSFLNGEGGNKRTIGYWLACLPGLGASICLLAAGTVFAEALFRARTRKARAGERRRSGLPAILRHRFGFRRPVERREPGDLPWPGLVGPTLLVVGICVMFGVWANIRADQAAADAGFDPQNRPAVIVLLLLLNAATVAVKVLAHNPYADRAEDDASRAAEAARSADRLLRVARKDLTRHVVTWSELRAAVAVAEDVAWRTVEDVCIGLVEERARTGVAGAFAFPLDRSAWPHPENLHGASETDGAHTRPPYIRLELLDHAREILKDEHPEGLRTRLEKAAALLNAQWGAEPEADPTPVSDDPDPGPGGGDALVSEPAPPDPAPDPMQTPKPPGVSEPETEPAPRRSRHRISRPTPDRGPIAKGRADT
ncbi:hypothetical protein ACFZBU_03980 [Embleya sp. NPDC008237]|uniref:hypothetical protein n=1 Tax=Embleya sp. NPDC008237 TaxID=3363978 RepID=UPI0036E0C02A